MDTIHIQSPSALGRSVVIENDEVDEKNLCGRKLSMFILCGEFE